MSSNSYRQFITKSPTQFIKRETIAIDNTSKNGNTTLANSSNGTVINTSNVSSLVSKEFQTPNSIRRNRNGTFHSFPIVNTPTPPSRFRKVINPFEAGITERLHLPLIDR